MDFTFIDATKVESYDNVQITTIGILGQFASFYIYKNFIYLENSLIY